MVRASLPPRKKLTPAGKERVLARFGRECAGCGKPLPEIADVFCWDHGVMRWFARDSNDRSLEQEANFRPLCEPCTEEKDDADSAARGKARRLNGTTPKVRKGRAIQSRGFPKGRRRWPKRTLTHRPSS